MDRRPHIWMVLVFAAFAILLADAAPFAKKSEAVPEDLALYKSKRPFCNAFTGCGRKRSDPEMSPSFGGGGEVDPEAEAQILAKRLASDMENWDRFQNRMQGIRRGNDGQRRFGFFPSFI